MNMKHGVSHEGKHRDLTASAYRLLREEFGPKRAEVAGE
jgi:hypothetical protein